MYSDFEVFRRDQEMLISEMEDQLHTFDYIEGFVVMNNHDPINGLKSVPFSPDADQAVSAMSSSFQRAVLLGSCRWLQPRRCWSGSRERKNTAATSRRPELISFCSS
jgi:hypothetical protein